MKKTKFFLIIFLILYLSLFLRIHDFENHVYVWGDSARDILTARESLRVGTIPLTTAFSSAGPFVFGPQYYWLLMVVYFFNFNSWNIFYYFLIMQSLFFVIVMMFIGKELVGRKFALVLGLVTAFSGRQIIRATYFSQHSFVALPSALAVLSLIKFFRKKNNSHVFWCAFWVSNSILLHYQALGLLVLILPFICDKSPVKEKFKRMATFVLGLILPATPFLVWDYQMQFANIRNVLDYVLIGQYRIYIPNRWTWHLFNFWPEYTADIFTGNNIFAGILLYFALGVLLMKCGLKKVNRKIIWIFLIFIFYFFYLRFYRGEKFEGYLMYLHPFILFILACGLYFFSKAKILFLALFLFAAFSSANMLKEYYANPKPNQESMFQEIAENLVKQSGSKKRKFSVFDFAIYDSQTETWSYSEAFSLYLDTKNMLDEKNGFKIGFCFSFCPKNAVFLKDKTLQESGHKIVLIDLVKKKNRDKFRLVNRSPHAVYEEMIFWWANRPLESSFSLDKFIYERTIGKFIKS